jgi:hypothetical protein
MHARVIAYNYLANKLGWKLKDSLAEVMHDADVNKVPVIAHQTYLVDSLKLVSTVYVFFKDKYYVKVVGDEVTEFYIFRPEDVAKQNITYVAYDVKTEKPVEYYKIDRNVETKYDFDTDAVKQVNFNITYDTLPENVKVKLKGFKYKKYIEIYAEKPYGHVIECSYNR